MGSKRGRLLIRQQRIKKDGEQMVTGDLETPDAAIYQEYLLSVPSQAKIERHASEPSPHTSSIITQQSLSGQSLLTVPTSHSYLIKQHSNPLLPSQSHAPPGTSYQLHRQLSHPIQTTSSVTTSMHHAQEIAASGQLLQLHKQRSHPTMSTQYTISEVDMDDVKLHHQTLSAQHSNSPTVVIVPDASSDGSHQQLQQQQQQQQPTIQKQQHLLQLPSLRIKSEELQRSVSQPLVSF